ncbi:hypothetical protein [Streptomyces sp. NPDC058084]|uniref:hypothetical protein n=1 Tax=Streptomyces sp. NPDC058084 TaxID=3346333 RepID=UPI0036EAABE8
MTIETAKTAILQHLDLLASGNEQAEVIEDLMDDLVERVQGGGNGSDISAGRADILHELGLLTSGGDEAAYMEDLMNDLVKAAEADEAATAA